MYDSPKNNYGTGLPMTPYSGQVGRSLSNQSRPTLTGDSSRDALARAQSDLNRTQNESQIQNFENQYQRQAEGVRSKARMGLLADLQSGERMEIAESIKNKDRNQRVSQAMRGIAAGLQSNRGVAQWRAIDDYIGIARSPAAIGGAANFYNEAFRPKGIIETPQLDALATGFGVQGVPALVSPQSAPLLSGMVQ